MEHQLIYVFSKLAVVAYFATTNEIYKLQFSYVRLLRDFLYSADCWLRSRVMLHLM